MKNDVAYEFLKNEIKDYSVYNALLEKEKDKKMRSILSSLAKTENKHADIWSKIAKRDRAEVHISTFYLLLYTLIRRIFGLTFTVRLLELNEINGAKAYAELLSRTKEKSLYLQLKSILAEEREHEELLKNMLEEKEAQLRYIRSIVFGLNDGLVEILAAVAGIAVVATSNFIVVAVGLIAGLSGTLSMAGGAYLSAKSEGLVSKEKILTSPSKEAYYTGIYYFLGALVGIAPFGLGFGGVEGIALSIIFVSVALSFVSFIIAVISGVSIKRRIIEMLAISLGAAAATILFGFFLKEYLHIVI